VLLTTQYLEEADRLADRIGVIHRGRIVREGTADELKVDVGGAVLELAVAEESRPAAMAALERLSGEEPLYDEATGRLRAPAPDGAASMLAAVRALDAVGVEPVDVALHKPTLDDVFLALTGDAPGSDETGDDDAAPGSGQAASTEAKIR
ncbi:MAG TPA: hypothetical protein VNU01_11335, partial [Egibacteraceae bacterium]|nr:hypothetical protein [Egibacteraceae bacterium]